MPSSTLVVMRLPRSSRWNVMAKRWASSRMRCSRYSASDWRGQPDRVGLARHVHLLEPLGQRRHRDLVVEAELLEHPDGHAELALAAVDQQQLRRVGELARRVSPAGVAARPGRR